MKKRAAGIALLMLLMGWFLPITPVWSQSEFEIVATLEEGPGNIAVTPDGRIIISQHQFYNTTYKVVEVLPDGQVQPFPNAHWNRPLDEGSDVFDTVLGLRSDPNGVVWMLDNGMRGKSTPKLVGWNTRTNQLEQIIYIPYPASLPESFLNDLAVDSERQTIYIADVAKGDKAALVVVDLKTGLSRRVLQGHPSTQAENISMVINGKPVRMLDPEGKPFEPKIGVNPITIDPQNQWVYYGAMHGTKLWRIPAAQLANPELTNDELGRGVELFSEKPISDGISMDAGGHIYITDVTRNAVGVVMPDGRYQVLHADQERLSWPDGMSMGPDNYVYVTVSKLQDSPKLNAGKNESFPPYYVVRFKALAPGGVGR